jgi:uncharacterized protein YjeT (DUF2065 family)
MFKIDLAKAFDSVGWVFLLELLVAIGCPRMWTNWISTILSTASTRILLNGTPGSGFAMVAAFDKGTLSLPRSSCL